jgi:hypothetical protein
MSNNYYTQKFILNHRFNYHLRFSKDDPEKLKLICDVLEEYHVKQDISLRENKIAFLKKFFMFLKDIDAIVDIFDEESFDDYLADDFLLKNKI